MLTVLPDMNARMMAVTPEAEFSEEVSTVTRLALLPPANDEYEPVSAARPGALPLALPEYGWLDSLSLVPSALVSDFRTLSMEEFCEASIHPTQPAPGLLRRACATTMPPPSDGSLICIR